MLIFIIDNIKVINVDGSHSSQHLHSEGLVEPDPVVKGVPGPYLDTVDTLGDIGAVFDIPGQLGSKAIVEDIRAGAALVDARLV